MEIFKKWLTMDEPKFDDFCNNSQFAAIDNDLYFRDYQLLWNDPRVVVYEQ